MSRSPSVKLIETIKQKNALDLEARKWSYKQEELRYLEAGQHLRSLNQLMWQVPGLAVAITGGLWYGAISVDSDLARRAVLGFATLFDLLTILIVRRLRDLIQRHIDLQSRFAHTDNGVAKRGRGTVVICWTIALIAASAVGGVGTLFPSTLTKKTKTAPTFSSCFQTSIEIHIKDFNVQQCIAKFSLQEMTPKSVLCLP